MTKIGFLNERSCASAHCLLGTHGFAHLFLGTRFCERQRTAHLRPFDDFDMKFSKLTSVLLGVLLLLGSFAVPVMASDADSSDALAADVTAAAVFTLSERASAYAANLTDGSAATYLQFKATETLQIALPVGTAGLVLEWYTLPSAYDLLVCSESGAVLLQESVKPSFLNMYHALPADAATLTLSFSAPVELSTVQLYGTGTLPSTVQRWTAPTDHPDVLLIAAYPGNVLECFGGLYPQLLADGVDVNILYLSWRTRRRTQEALTALWAMGQTVYPYCMEFQDRGANNESSIWVDWGRTESNRAVSAMLQTIRPSVIVTHASAGDSTHDSAATINTSTLVREAIERAATRKDDPFTPQKVYLHETSDNATTLSFDTPLWRFAGATASQVAAQVFADFAMTRQFMRTITQSDRYTLVQSQVGEDTARNDLLEHISYSPLFTAEPSPTPTPSPIAEPTATPALEAPTASAIPTAEPSAATTDTPEQGLSHRAILCLALLGTGLVGTVILLCLFGLLRRKLSVSAAALIACLPLLLAVLACGVLLLVFIQRPLAVPAASVSPTASPTAAPTASPTAIATDTPAPTDEPADPTEAIPSASPTASSAFADKFLPEDSTTAEQITSDETNGQWSYRSDTFAVEIERHQNNKPLVWYVAHIYMREVDAVRGIISAPNYSGMYTIIPWQLARMNKAVLMVTGDNLLNMDVEMKGILIRDGKVFLNRDKREGCVAFYPETLSMKTYEKGAVTANELLQQGVVNAYSFGPVLLSNGVRSSSIADSRLYKLNPRTGVGMVEPGHFVVIVVDGRREEYSVGVTLDDFVKMFEAEGCTEAYNLDGGISACMVFMGEQLNHHGNEKNYSQQRGIPDALGFGYSNSLPSLDDPVYNTGSDTN